MFDAFIRRCIEGGKPIFPKRYKLDGPSEYCPDAFLDNIHLKPCVCRRSLAEYEAETNSPWRWSCQMNNDPVADEFIEFKREYFKSFVFDNEHNLLLRDIKGLLCLDPATSQKASADFSGFTVSKMTKDNFIYIVEAKQIKLTPDDVIEEIFKLVDLYNIDRVLVETVSAAILWIPQIQKEMIKRNKRFILIPYTPSNAQNKETRIRALIPYYAVGQIIHRKGLQDLENQLIEFPRNRHDDIIDSLANHIPYWLEHTKGKVKASLKEGSLAWWHTKLPQAGKNNSLFKDVIQKRRRF